MKKWLAVIAIVALLIAQQDYWSTAQWERKEFVFGFLPYTIAYHSVVSIAAALVWIFVCFACWPKELDEIVESDVETVQKDSSKGAQA